MTKVGNLTNTTSSQFKKQLFYLQKEFQDRLIVIDEVHNIRQVDDSTSKTTINEPLVYSLGRGKSGGVE